MSGDDLSIFGDLYGTAAMRRNFSAERGLGAMLDVEVALARAQERVGVIPAGAAAAIAAAADVRRLDVTAMAKETENVGYPIVGLVKALAQLAGPDAGRYVHWGATTQDIMDTAVALQMGDALGLFLEDLTAIVRAFAALAKRHRDDPMAGRTHMQHALPITFGYKVAVWLAPLVGHVERLRAQQDRVRTVEFAGAAGTLASLGERGRSVVVELGAELNLHVPDAPWHVDRALFADAVCAVGIACGSLAKIATDVILLSQVEVGEVFEPYVSGRGSSSTMPQKRNPIACEYILASTRGVHALVPMMLGAMAQDHERATGPWQSERIAVPQAFILASAAFAQTRALAEGMTVDAGRMRRNLDATQGLIASEAVAMALAERIGKRKAHDLVEHACEVAIDRGRSLAGVLAEHPDVAREFTHEQLARLLDPAAYVGESGDVVDRVVASAEKI